MTKLTTAGQQKGADSAYRHNCKSARQHMGSILVIASITTDPTAKGVFAFAQV